ncbi:MAG TPA: hypothetical protein PLE19_13425 [Planctomycetota bacterium]|nr:hypothetical protein [Planctomycetota bacterium]HRR81373.1 hypothetical protein [Planctomycetota bacterium]HRT96434.1 hypothetical protein [Planctomycetota bacterium]
MPTGMRGAKDFYKERFGLSDRLAVRLAALLAHKVDLTAAAIECLRDSPALQHVVLHPRLFEATASLDTDSLKSLALPGEQLPGSFVVCEAGGWKTIALEEELLAEQGAPEEPEAAQLPALTPRGQVLHPSEIHDLFTRRDIAELELTLRTSADPKEKVTAIRRLALSPASDREKMALFAAALMDREAEVRSEAAQALASLGLAPEVAEDARFLAEGNERQRQSAAQRLGRRFRTAADTELGVLLRLIAGTLRYETSVDVRRLLIRGIEGACRSVARDARGCQELVHVLLTQLRDAAEELGPEVRRVLLLLGEANPEGVSRTLEHELASIADHRVRRPLVAAAIELASTAEARDRAVAQGIAEIEASADPSVECLQILNALGKTGDPVVPAVAERLLGAPEAAQEALVRLLDILGGRPKTPPAVKARIGLLLLDALRRGHRAARLAVINSLAAADPALPSSTRRALAAELLRSLQEYASPGILAAIEAMVAKLGAPALPPLLEMVQRGERPASRLAAARVLGELAARLRPREAAQVARAVSVVIRQLGSGFPDRAVLARTLGQMCSGPAAAREVVATAAATLRSLILEKGMAHAALDGLGRLCLSPRVEPALKVELLDFFGRILDRDLPDIEAKSLGTKKDEVVYALGGEVSAYTELVPGVLAGLRNIALTSSGVPHERAVERLIRTWREIADGSLQLGPGNTDLLLQALRDLGTLPDLPLARREAIAEAIALRRDYLPTVRVLADVLVAAGSAMAPRAAALAEELLHREATDRQLTANEHGILLETLVRLATAAALGRAAGRLRERIVGAVVDARNREIERAAALVRTLAQSPAIPQKLKKRLPPSS